MKWVKRIGGGILLLVAVALLFGFSYELLSRSRADKNYPPPGKLVTVSDHKLHALAKGSGSPTVIFESGLGFDGHMSWYKVQDEVAKFTQAVSYDRAGVMWSGRGSNEKSAAMISAELKLMLENGGFEPPYIFVGHSLAGLTGRPFISDNQDHMEGVVFVDVSHPNQYEATPEELKGGGSLPDFLLAMLRIFGGMRYIITSAPLPTDDPNDAYSTIVPHMIHRSKGAFDESAQTEMIAKEVQLIESFGDIPLVVITGASPTRNDNMNVSQETREYMTRKWHEFQEDLLNLSSSSDHIMAMKSGHHVQISEPELVIESIRDLVNRWRSKESSVAH